MRSEADLLRDLIDLHTTMTITAVIRAVAPSQTDDVRNLQC